MASSQTRHSGHLNAAALDTLAELLHVLPCPVGAFIGLILLATALIVGGAVLLVGAEHVKSLVGKRNSAAAAAESTEATAPSAASRGEPPSKHPMRPYRVAKATGVPRGDRLYGLVFVIAGLGLLLLIPSYLFKDNSARVYPPPPPSYSDMPSYSRKFSLSESAPGQAVWGVMTLGVLLAVFAFLAPEKQTKKAADVVQSRKKTK